jgi:hypothetical protein
MGGRPNTNGRLIEDQWEVSRTPTEHQWETNGREPKGNGRAMGEKSGKMSRKRKNVKEKCALGNGNL